MPLRTAKKMGVRELSLMREDAEMLLPDFCTIQTATIAADAIGSQSITYANTHVNVPCRLSAFIFRDRELIFAGGVFAPERFTLTLPWDQAVGLKDRVVHEAKTYEVVALDQDTASYRTVKRVDVTRVS